VEYLCSHHSTWIPKYRRPILTGDLAGYAKEVLTNIVGELGCEIMVLEVMPHHIQFFVNWPPRYSASYLAFKGKWARLILRKFPSGKGKLWAVSTAGSVSDQTI
jgi:putative transposase